MEKSTWFVVVVSWIFGALCLIFAPAGCGQLDVNDLGTIAYKDGPAVIACAPDEYSAVKSALSNGSTNIAGAIFDWVSAIGMLGHCVKPVVTDLIKAYKGEPLTKLRALTYKLAYLDDERMSLLAGPMTPPHVPRAVARRCYFALRLCALLSTCK